MEKLNRAHKYSILGNQNLRLRGGPGPWAPLDPHLVASTSNSIRFIPQTRQMYCLIMNYNYIIL